MVVALVALGLVAVTVGLTVVWNRQTRTERRVTHVENEIGVSDDERVRAEEGRAVKRPHHETIRSKLHAIDRRFEAVTRRHARLVRAR